MPRCAAYHSTSRSYGEPASQVSLPPKTPTQNSQSFPHSSPKLPHSSRMFEVSGRFLLSVLSITRVHSRKQISRPNVHGSRCTPSPAWWSPSSHSSGAVTSSAIGSRPNLPRRQAPRGVMKTAIPQTRIAGRLNSIAGQISSMESLHAHNHNNSPRPPPAITITTSRPSDMSGNPMPYCTHLRHLL